MRSIAAAEKFRTDGILKYKTGGRALEIGPWRGVICSNMKNAGFAVTAIEMDANCVRFLRDQLGVEAIQSTDPAAAMQNLKPGFDVIIAWHSLEHLPHPWLVIERAAQLLAPGGILLPALPNPDSFEFSVVKARWMHLDAPHHLHLLPIASLVQICEKHNLRLQEVTTNDRFSKNMSFHAWRVYTRCR